MKKGHLHKKQKTTKHHPEYNQNDDSKFRDILLISNDWIWEIDTEGVITFTSGQIKEILGYETEEIIGTSVFEMFLPEEKEKLKSEIKKIISLEKPIINRINWNLSKDGRKVCLVTNGVPIYDKNNQLKGYRGVDKDITQQKQTEENLRKEIEEKSKIQEELKIAREKAEQAFRSKSDFFTKLNQEIKNPMNGIIGTIALLRETRLSNEQVDFLNVIETSATSLLSIINDILDLSEIESGKAKLEKEKFNLIELLNKIERQHANVTKDKKLNFSIEIKPGVPKFLRGDLARLKQILHNLLSNAIKFTKQGGITVTVEKKHEFNNSIELLFRVVDTGTGVTEKIRDHLFKEYTSPLLSITKSRGGTGLGLLICKKIVDLLGGRIGYESKEGKGSTFWFTIELQHAVNPEPKPMETPIEEGVKNSSKLSILVAEDNIINQKVAMANLRQLGHDVEIAVNGKMAVEMYKKNYYDLILMDIQMPVMDGITATEQIRKIEKDTDRKPKIKIVAITANASKEDKAKCLKIGMDGYIIKPFKIEDLDDALKLKN